MSNRKGSEDPQKIRSGPIVKWWSPEAHNCSNARFCSALTATITHGTTCEAAPATCEEARGRASTVEHSALEKHANRQDFSAGRLFQVPELAREGKSQLIAVMPLPMFG